MFVNRFSLIPPKFPVYIFLFLLTLSCTSNKEYNKLLKERDSLSVVIEEQDKTFSEFESCLDTLSLSIDSLYLPEVIQLLSPYKEDGIRRNRTEIKLNFDKYTNILMRQKERINSLQDSLLDKNQNIEKLKSVFTFLNSQLDEKEYQLRNMKIELTKKNSQIASLHSTVSSLENNNADLRQDINNKTDIINEQNSILKAQNEYINQGYVLIGSRKTIKNTGLIKNFKFSDYSGLNVPLVAVCNVPPIAFSNVPPQKWLL